MNADGDATKAAVAHDDGLDALLGARQRSGRQDKTRQDRRRLAQPDARGRIRNLTGAIEWVNS